MRAFLLDARFFAGLRSARGISAGNGSPSAQTTPSSLVYEAVDKYRFAGRTLYLTGTVQGQAAASSSQYFLLLDDVQSCERMLLTSINRPGRFLFSLEGLGGGQATCALERRP